MAEARKYLMVEAAGLIYGVSTSRIREVTPCGEILPVPDSPAFLRGVTNLRRETVPVVDLAVLLGERAVTVIDSRSCFVIVTARATEGNLVPICLLVHRVHDSVCFEPGQIDATPEVGGHVQATYLFGIGRMPDGVLLLLELDRVFGERMHAIQSINSAPTQSASEKSASSTSRGHGDDGRDAACIRILTLRLGDTQFGFPLKEISHIVPAPVITPDPVAPPFAVGSAEVVGRRVAVVNLIERLGVTSEASHVEQRSIVLVEHGKDTVGYLVDDVGRLHSVAASEMRQNESFGRMLKGNRPTQGFVELPQGTLEVLRFDGILSADELAALRNWINTTDRIAQISMSDVNRPKEKPVVSEDARRLAGTYLLVRVGRHVFAISARCVHAVLSAAEVIPLPATRPDFAGLYRLRDRSFGVVDLATRLDAGAKPDAHQAACVVMVGTAEANCGVRVEQVLGLVAVPAERIRVGGAIDAQVHRHFILGGVESDEGARWILDLDAVLRDDGPSLRESLRRFEQEARANGAGAEYDRVVGDLAVLS